MLDATVTGARCAGAATAMLLARLGHKVLLLDKARFPSDVPRGISFTGAARCGWQRWGLLDRIERSGCPPVTRTVSDMGDFAMQVTGVECDGVAWGYGPRRKVLDRTGPTCRTTASEGAARGARTRARQPRRSASIHAQHVRSGAARGVLHPGKSGAHSRSCCSAVKTPGSSAGQPPARVAAFLRWSRCLS